MNAPNLQPLKVLLAKTRLNIDNTNLLLELIDEQVKQLEKQKIIGEY